MKRSEVRRRHKAWYRDFWRRREKAKKAGENVAIVAENRGTGARQELTREEAFERIRAADERARARCEMRGTGCGR